MEFFGSRVFACTRVVASRVFACMHTHLAHPRFSKMSTCDQSCSTSKGVQRNIDELFDIKGGFSSKDIFERDAIPINEYIDVMHKVSALWLKHPHGTFILNIWMVYATCTLIRGILELRAKWGRNGILRTMMRALHPAWHVAIMFGARRHRKDWTDFVLAQRRELGRMTKKSPNDPTFTAHEMPERRSGAIVYLLWPTHNAARAWYAGECLKQSA